VDEEHRRRAALGQRVPKIVGARSVAPRIRERHDLAAEGPAHRLPALAELALRDGEDALRRRQQVDDRRLERAGSGCRQHEDLVLRAEHLAQPLLGEPEDLREVRRAVVEHRPGERGEHLGRHRRRPWREELLRARHRL
jgi:hypothetical protein